MERSESLPSAASPSSQSPKQRVEDAKQQEHAAQLQSSQGKADGSLLFDCPTYNPISLVNKLYPDEASLTDMERFAEALRRQVRDSPEPLAWQ